MQYSRRHWALEATRGTSMARITVRTAGGPPAPINSSITRVCVSIIQKPKAPVTIMM